MIRIVITLIVINTSLICTCGSLIYINILGIRAITSLLCGTLLNPVPGDPTSSEPVTRHRNPEMLYLGSG